MKKAAVIFVLVIVAAFAALIALALNSGFQTKLANEYLAEKFPNARIEKLSVSPFKAEVRGIEIRLSDALFTAKFVEVDFFVPALFSKKVEADSIVLKGARLVLKTGGTDAKKTVRTPFVSAKTTSFSAGNEKPRKQNYDSCAPAPSLSDSVLETFSKWEISVKSLSAELAIQSSDGKVLEFSADAKNAAVKRHILPTSLDLKISCKSEIFGGKNLFLRAETNSKKERTNVKILLLRGAQKLFACTGYFFDKLRAGQFEMQTDADSRTLTELSSFFKTMPVFDSRIYINAKFDNFGADATAELRAKNSIKSVPFLPEIGNAQLNAEAEVKRKAGEFFIKKFTAFFSENSVNTIAASTPANLKIDALDSSKILESAVVNVVVSGFEASKLNGLFGGVKFSKTPLYGAFALKKQGGKYALKTIEPMHATSLDANKNNAVLFENINAKFSANATFEASKPSPINAELEIFDADGASLKLGAGGTISNGLASFSLKADGALSPLAERSDSISKTAANLSVRARAEAGISRNRAEISKGFAEFFDGKNGKVLTLKQGLPALFEFGKSFKPTEGTVFTVNGGEIPFSLLKPFAGSLDAKSATVRDVRLSWSRSSGYSLKGDFALKAIHLKCNDKVYFSNINIDTNAHFDFVDGKLKRADFQKASVADGLSVFASGAGCADFGENARVQFKISLTLPPLFAQPYFSDFYIPIDSATADIDAKISRKSAKLCAKIHNLKITGANGEINTLSLSTNASAKDFFARNFDNFVVGNKVKTMSTSGRSDFSIGFEDGVKPVFSLDAKQLEMNDIFLVLTALGSGAKKSFSSRTKDAADIAAAKKQAREAVSTGRRKFLIPNIDDTEKMSEENEISKTAQKKKSAKKIDTLARRDARAAWDLGRAAKMKVNVATLTKDGSGFARNINWTAEISPGEICVDDFCADVLGALSKASFKLSFSKYAPAPYSLKKAKVSIENFEAANLFDSRKSAPWTGVYNLSALVDGTGNNIDHLLKFLTFEAKAENTKGGSIRMLNPNSAAGYASGIASVAMRLAGNFLNGKIKEIDGLAQLAEILGEAEYEMAIAKISRNSDTYNFNIDSAKVKARDFVLSVKDGAIFFDAEKNFSQFEMEIPVEILVADGSLAKLFQKLDFCLKDSSARGYKQGPVFGVFGTVGRPDNNLAEVLLGRAEKNISPKINIFK